MDRGGAKCDVAIEHALGTAHAALRALESIDPSAATLPAAHSIRRAIGALLDAADRRTTVRSGLDRAAATLSFALAALGGEGDDEGVASPLRGEALVRAVEATVAAIHSATDEELDAPPIRSPDRVPPRWSVADREPHLVDVPRRSLLPPDAIMLPPDPTNAPAAAQLGEGARRDVSGLDVEAMLAQSDKLAIVGAALGAQLTAATEQLAPFGAAPKGDLEVGALLGDAPPVLTEAQFARANAREHFEDVGMFGLQRLPLFGDDFADVEPIELRLLASCDALLGDPSSLMDLERLARDTPAADPMRVFAISFVAGVLEGRDGLAAAERTLYAHDPNDPAIADAFGTGLVLAPNPLADRVLKTLLRAEEAPVRAAALRALARRGAVDVGLLADAAESDDPLIIAAVLPALSAARHPHADEMLMEIAARERDREDLGVAIALWEALAIGQRMEAAAFPRLHLKTSLAGPASIALAIVGDASDAHALLERADAGPTVAMLTALGWAGSLEAVPLLMTALGDEALSVAAARALERMLGGAEIVSVDVDPESLLVMEPLAIRTPSLLPRGPLVAAMQDEDEDAEASADEMMLPTTDVGFWKRRLDVVRRALPKDGEALRLRRGAPYLPAMSLSELGQTGETLRPSFAERQLLARELSARTGRPVDFSAEDLVVVQLRKLAACQKLLGVPATAGTFSRPVRTALTGRHAGS